jgi:hypothetical protein
MTAKVLIVIGIVLILIGLSLHFFGNIFSWFGNLPGDIKIKRQGFSFYFPLTSMLLISLLINIIIKIFGRY